MKTPYLKSVEIMVKCSNGIERNGLRLSVSTKRKEQVLSQTGGIIYIKP